MNTAIVRQAARVAVIVATQRSGTTAIGRFLGRQPGTEYVGEIFHNVRGPHDDPNYERYLTVPEANFFTFKERLLTRFPALAYPSRANQSAIWHGYRKHLFSLGPETTWVIDVKYNSLHNLNAVWQDLFNAPLLVELLREENAPILHLVRDDLFAQAISALRANQLRTWHNVASNQTAEKQPTEAAMTFEPQQVDRMMNRNMHLKQHFRYIFSTYPNIGTLAYEDAFVDGQVSDAARSMLADLFNGGTPLEGETDLQKRESGTLADRIANRDAMLKHFENSPHESMVSTHLRPDHTSAPHEAVSGAEG